jgi:hypothetical protein
MTSANIGGRRVLPAGSAPLSGMAGPGIGQSADFSPIPLIPELPGK